MTLKHLLCITLTLAIFWHCNGHQTYTISSDGTLRLVEGTNCTSAGFMCDGCLASYNCYQLPNGTWIKELVEDCNATQTTCLRSTGLCTNESNILCSRGFVCTQTGIFPDLTDCSKYHICAAGSDGIPVDYPEECAEGYSYDPLTTLCSKIRVANCTVAAPTCNGTSYAVALPENPRMFYQCSLGALAPRVLYCGRDYKFIKGRCHDVNKEFNVDNGTCLQTGYFYRPNCTTMSNCRANSPQLIQSCIKNYFFNYNVNTCYYFTCDTLFL